MLRQVRSKFCYGVVLGVSLFTTTFMTIADDAFAFRYPPPPNHGRVVTQLPPGHSSFRVGRQEYYHHGGVYYRHNPRGYVVVGAPIGAVIAALPIGFATVIVAGNPFFYSGGIYYRQVPAGYMVVEPPPEVVVVQQPPAPAPAAAKAGDRVNVSVQSLNVRSGPGMNFSVVQIVNQGETLEVFGNAPGWLYVRCQSDRFGWVQEAYTSPVSVAPSG